jgi:hypothetical protein
VEDSKVVEAVGAASIAITHRALGRAVEAAAGAAIHQASAAGISTTEANTPILRACMNAARQAVKAAFEAGAADDAPARATADVAQVLAEYQKG